MTSKNSGIPAAAASPDTHLRHVIAYTAHTPDDGETRGIATVTTTGPRIPFDAWGAGIPGLIAAHVVETSGDTRGERPVLLGPGPDAPGHPVWCVRHHDDDGDARSLCWGQREPVGVSVAHLSQCTGEPVMVWLDLDGTCEGEELTPAEAREQAAELRELAARLDVLADQADAEAVAR